MAGRLLIHDAIASNRIVLRCKLSAACYDVVSADTVQSVFPIFKSDRPDAVLLDGDADQAAAIEICRQLASLPKEELVPVILLSTDAGVRLSALRAGATMALPKPLHEDFLLASLRRVMRHHLSFAEACRETRGFQDLGMAEAKAAPLHPGRVVFLSRSKQFLSGWRNAATRQLSDLKINMLHPDQVLVDRQNDQATDVFIFLATEKQSMDGFGLLSELRSRNVTKSARAILLIDHRRIGIDEAFRQAAMALDLGADEIVFGPMEEDDLATKIKCQLSQKKASDQMARTLRSGLHLATRDPLTGLYNRRYAKPRLLRMLEECHRAHQPLALLSLDLDRFKKINDTFGHAAGDAVLIEVAHRLRSSVRPEDLVARSGGEEFLIALPNTTTPVARQIARALRNHMRSSPVTLPYSRDVIRVTASIGAAMTIPTADITDSQLDRLMRRADSALYAAKSDGRDTVTFASFAA